jgi:hypothetical protein
MKMKKEDWPLLFCMPGGLPAGTVMSGLTGWIIFFYSGEQYFYLFRPAGYQDDLRYEKYNLN